MISQWELPKHVFEELCDTAVNKKLNQAFRAKPPRIRPWLGMKCPMEVITTVSHVMIEDGMGNQSTTIITTIIGDARIKSLLHWER